MRKGSGSVYDKWNISVVICDIDNIICQKLEHKSLYVLCLSRYEHGNQYTCPPRDTLQDEARLIRDPGGRLRLL
jgi:hypothetical protein